MIDFLPFLKILPVFVVSLISPGPAFMMVSTTSLARGRIAGLQSAAGIATGDAIYASLSLWGLGLIFERALWLVLTIKILGGLYLCYLGVQMVRTSFEKTNRQDMHVMLSGKQKNPFFQALFTGLTNPKALAFFGSVFVLALTPETNAPTKVVMPLLCALAAFVWFALVTMTLSLPRIRARYQQWRRAIDRMTGAILILFGARLALSGKE